MRKLFVPLALALALAFPAMILEAGKRSSSSSRSKSSKKSKAPKQKKTKAPKEKTVHVKEYTRKDGTRVRAHDRTAPGEKKKGGE